MNNGYDWECKTHGTFGDNGWSCAHCGYPTGTKNLEIKNGELKILKATINLFFFTLFVFTKIKL